jgi:hypothetical protein
VVKRSGQARPQTVDEFPENRRSAFAEPIAEFVSSPDKSDY